MRSVEEIQILLETGESTSVEFKMKYDRMEVLRAITAFTNDLAEQGGGILLLGIEPKSKQPVGIDDLDGLQQRIASSCKDAIEPPVSPTMYIAPLENLILVVEIHAGERTPYRLGSDCFVRVGSTTRRATFEDELILHNKRTAPTGGEEIPGDLPPQEDFFHEFIGRTAELEELWEWVCDERRRRHTLAGEGGVGKTAIAYELASRVKQSRVRPYEHLVWMSAKRVEFIKGAIVERSSVDFWDLSSALDKILDSLGFEFEGKTIEEKEDDVLSLAKAFPIFIVVDDIDSLTSHSQDASDFLTFRLPSVGAKVLATSRRELHGMPTTRVLGFDTDEGVKFIRSRLSTNGVAVNTLSVDQMENLLAAATYIPLYVEDLLRLAINLGDSTEAARLWKECGAGDEARDYALKREFEMLSADAKLLMLSASVAQQPLSGKELGILANMSPKRTNAALDELQGRFFIPRPSLIEAMSRFDLNANTRRLVMDLAQQNRDLSNQLKRVAGAYTAMFGDIYSSRVRRGVVGTIIEQSVALVRIGNTHKAEQLIADGLSRFPEDPELHGIAGYVFKKSRPKRTTDARERFRRAFELKSRNSKMYQNWIGLEVEEGSLDGELEASLAWSKTFPKSLDATLAYGSALSKIGQRLLRENQHERGLQVLRDAERELLAALVQ